METKVVLLGPPGVGKSTIIRAALDHSMRAVDGESWWEDDSTHNFAVLQALGLGQERLLVGGAGFSVEECRSAGFETALLYLPDKEYRGRRTRRDSRDPEKAGQAEHDMADWVSNWNGDFVIDASRPVGDLVSALREYIGSGDLETLRSQNSLFEPSRGGGPDALISIGTNQPQAGEAIQSETQIGSNTD